MLSFESSETMKQYSNRYFSQRKPPLSNNKKQWSNDWRLVHTLHWWSEKRDRGMVSKWVWLGDRGVLEAFVNVALYEPFHEGSYMRLEAGKLQNKKMIFNIPDRHKQCLRWSICAALFPAQRGDLKKKEDWQSREANIRILQAMCLNGKRNTSSCTGSMKKTALYRASMSW